MTKILFAQLDRSLLRATPGFWIRPNAGCLTLFVPHTVLQNLCCFVSSFNLRAMSEIFLLPQADCLVSPDWVRSCCEPDFASEALLHEARFHAAPAVRQK